MVTRLGRLPLDPGRPHGQGRRTAVLVIASAAGLLLSMLGATPVHASGGTFKLSWLPAAPTNQSSITLTASISGCGVGNTSAPVMEYELWGPAPSTAFVSNAFATSLTGGGDVGVGTATIGPLVSGTYQVDAVGIAPTPCFATLTSTPRAILTVVGPPAAPTSASAFDNPDGSAAVDWTPPADTGGTPITAYTVTPSPACAVVCSGLTTAGTVSSTTVAGLTQGTSYTFTVTATNAKGTGPPSAPSASMVSAAVPGAPTGVTATGHPDGTVTLAWTAPASDNGSPITAYVLDAGTCACSVLASALSPPSMTVSGLAYDTAYQFRVAATNAAGTGVDSLWSNSVTIASAAPDAPSGATAGANPDGSVNLSWTAPADNGAAITSYIVTPSPACTGCSGLFVNGTPASTTTTVAGLTLGTAYSFSVTAKNTHGFGSASSPSNAVTAATAPGAPATVQAIAKANGTVDVTWAAVGDNGSAVTGYALTPMPPCSACTGLTVSGAPTTPSTTVAGLTLGTAYTFTVTATNGVGTGAASSPSSAVTPALAPGTPSSVVAAANPDGSVALSWTAPSGNGGAIVAYTITPSPACTACAGLVVTGNPAAASSTVSGLALGTSYTFTVTAKNTVGTSVASAPSNALTPATAPDAPTAVQSVANADGSVDVAWTAPSGNGSGVTGYAVTTVPACTSCTGLTVSGAPATPSTTISGVTPGMSYTFTVTATNAVGPGPASVPSSAVTPSLAPDAPSGVVTTANGNGTLTVTWLTPADNGSGITGYTLTPSPACTTCSGLTVGGAPPVALTVVGGVTVGASYTFTVTATNAIGTSTASAPAAAVVVTAPPGMGQVPSAIEGNGQATVTWSASAANGSPITSYAIVAAPGGNVCTWTAGPLTCTVTGLSNGTAYAFTVTAVNGVGPGAASPPSAAVIPAIPALRITLSATAALSPLGAEVTLDGTGLMPGSTASVVVHSTPLTLAAVSAGMSGTFSSVVTIPTSLAPGNHMLTATATGYDGSVLMAQTSFTVASSSPLLTPSPSTAAPPTPEAGSGVMSGLAALLIITGAVLSRATRRRRVNR